MDLDAVRKRSEGFTNYFEGRRARAASRLELCQEAGWYFALLGLSTAVPEFEISPGLKLKAVVEPPGEVELAGALRDSHLFGAIGRYSHAIRYELLVVSPGELYEHPQAVFNLAYWAISALRVRSMAEILVPVAADHSWSCIAGISDRTCVARFIEDMPCAQRLEEVVEVNLEHLDWVRHYLDDFDRMGSSPKFRLAVHSYCNHHQTTDLRMMVATLWSGIEALFGIQQELRFRLAAMIAAVLEPRGETRRETYRKVKCMYDLRSKAVHGSEMSDSALRSHILETRRLLSRLICAFTEAKRVYTEQEIEDLIFV
jgi:hypothetical protein